MRWCQPIMPIIIMLKIANYVGIVQGYQEKFNFQLFYVDLNRTVDNGFQMSSTFSHQVGNKTTSYLFNATDLSNSSKVVHILINHVEHCVINRSNTYCEGDVTTYPKTYTVAYGNVDNTFLKFYQSNSDAQMQVFVTENTCYEPALSNDGICMQYRAHIIHPTNVQYCICNNQTLDACFGDEISNTCNSTTISTTTRTKTSYSTLKTTTTEGITNSTISTLPENSSPKSSTLLTTVTFLSTLSPETGSTSTPATTAHISTTVSSTITEISSTTDSTSTTSNLQTTTEGVPSLDSLAKENFTITNVGEILNQTVFYTQEKQKLLSHQIDDIATILWKASNVFNITEHHTHLIMTNLDYTLWANESQWRNSNSSNKRMLHSLSNMMESADSVKRINYLNGTNFGFFGRRKMCSDNLELENGMIDMGSGGFGLLNGTMAPKRNSIRVNLTSYCKDGNRDRTHVYFTIYRNRNLFVGNQYYRPYSSSSPISHRNTVRNSNNQSVESGPQNYTDNSVFDMCTRQYSLPNTTPVMTGTVLIDGESVSRASDGNQAAGVLQFNISSLLQPLHGNFIVTWWDVENEMWSQTNHCDTKLENGILMAYCDHLTDFTLIVDAAPNDAQVCSKPLEIIGYIANGLSIASLAFVFFINFSAYIDKLGNSKSVRYLNGYFTPKRDPISLAYNGTLLMFYFMFTVFSNQKVSDGACQVVAAIAYCLLLSSIILTIFQALRTVVMFLPHALMPLLRIFLRPINVVTISLLIPFIISLCLLVFTLFFQRQDGFCWVRPDYVVFAIIIPLSVLIGNALVCTLFIAYRLFGRDRTKFSRAGKTKGQAVRTKVAALLMMQITLGTPWVLQYFTLFHPGATAWNYVFTIVLGSQGTLLFLLFFYKRRAQANQASSRRELTQTQTRSRVDSQLQTSQTVLDDDSVFDD